MSISHFRPITVSAHYPSIPRGLTADVLAARALGGMAYPVCSTHVVAGRGVVTDVLDVPTDSVSAQLEHLFETEHPTGAKIGVVGHPATVHIVFQHLKEHLSGPVVLDLTLSGPSGEDLMAPRALDALVEQLAEPDLVMIRRTDAQLVAGMEIPSLDDAQVAAQRIAERGAQRVLLRCGRIPTHHFDPESPPPQYAVDLFFDGSDFALFEAPYLDRPDVHGASSALSLAVLRGLSHSHPLPEALQSAKAYVTEALKHGGKGANQFSPDYFWRASLAE